MLSTDLIKAYENAQILRRNAEKWYKLSEEKDWAGRPFKLSAQHCTIKLTICGQKRQGDRNYHDSPKELNEALAKVIEADFHSLVKKGIAHLKAEEEDLALAARMAMEEMLAKLPKECQ